MRQVDVVQNAMKEVEKEGEVSILCLSLDAGFSVPRFALVT
jgi:hypothetical protein